MSRRRRLIARIAGGLFWGLLLGFGVAHALRLMPLRMVTQLDRAIADTRTRLSASNLVPPGIAIVDIDERSLAEIGRWPWGRDTLARLTDELFERQKVAAAGFDLVFAEPDTGDLPLLETLAVSDPALAARLPELRRRLDRDAVFAKSLQGRAVVLSHYFSNDRGGARQGSLPAAQVAHPSALPHGLTRWDGYAASLPLLAQAAPHGGFINALPDDDGVLRSAALVAEFDGQAYEALSLALWRLGQRASASTLLVAESPVGLVANGVQVGAMRFATDDRAAVQIPYRQHGGPLSGAFTRVSAADLLLGRVAPASLAGFRVLVGTSVPALADLRPTPIHAALPGVEVHASLIAGLDSGRLRLRPDWAAGYEVLLLCGLALVLGIGLPQLSPPRTALAFLLVFLLLLGVHQWAWQVLGLLLPVAGALLLLVMGFAVTMAWGYLVEGRSRRLLVRLFGSYVPPTLVARMARDPERYTDRALRAENRELSLLFCDLRGFTTLSEHFEPQALRELLNEFFSRMSAVIYAHGGTLDKFIGDALMAFWGAPLAEPRHAAQSVRAALAMQQALASLNTELTSRGTPTLSLGIGIHSGVACVGDMGSNLRRAYTALGDSVNLASRIEGLTRRYGVDLLVSAQTREAVADKSLAWVEVGEVHVKGRSQAVTLYTLPPDGVAADPRWDEQLRLWLIALASVRSQHWADAEAPLRALHTITHPGDVMRHLHDALAQQVSEEVARHQATPR